MHILQISGDFCNTKVHMNLYKALSARGITQTIYCPVRNEEQIGQNSFVADNTAIIYDYVVKPYHRYVYHVKRMDMFRSLQTKVTAASNGPRLQTRCPAALKSAAAAHIKAAFHRFAVVAQNKTFFDLFVVLVQASCASIACWQCGQTP